MQKLIPFRIIPDRTNIKFIPNKNKGFAISLFLVFMSLFSLFLRGLNLGIDFTGGIILELKTEQVISLSDIRYALNQMKIGDVSIQNFGSEKDLMIKIGVKDKSKTERTKIIETIKTTLEKISPSNIDYRKVEFVGPQVGEALIQNGVISILLSFLAIMIYVWFRFEWQFGVGVVLALVHDIIVTLGFLSLVFLEFDLTTIAALLTVIGYSVNDSVVIYDRIRENLKKYKKMKFDEILNLSINQTLSRTILTVLTTLLAAAAIVVFGGKNLYSFSITVFLGIVIGTYSSIYISAPILTHLTSNTKNSEDY
jgi:preprotein translocase subunit SecF